MICMPHNAARHPCAEGLCLWNRNGPCMQNEFEPPSDPSSGTGRSTPCSGSLNSYLLRGGALVLVGVGLVRGVCLLTVLVEVKAPLLGWHNRHEEVQALEEHEGDNHGVGRAEESGHSLLTELLPRAGDRARVHTPGRSREPRAFRRGALTGVRKHAQQNCADEATHAMHTPDVQGVIEAQPPGILAARVAEHGGDNAQHEGPPGLDETGSGSHRGQACDGANAKAHELRPAKAVPVNAEPHQQCNGGCDLRIHCCCNCHAAARQRRAAVEAEPAEPQECRAKRHEGNVVRFRGLAIRGRGTLAHHEQARQSGEARGNVYHNAACEVKDSPLRHPAAAPHPVAEGRVDQDHPEHDEDRVGLEAKAVRKGACHQGRRDHREHALVGHEERPRDAVNEDLALPHQRLIHVHVHREEVSRWTPEEGPRLPEAEREENDVPENADDSHWHHALPHHRQDAVLVHEAPVEEGQAGRHELHQGHADHDVSGARWIHHHGFEETLPGGVLLARSLPSQAGAGA
mmetsp:Transcript_16631/g.22888  ORF Transcript_16631/g.22888 Transcript_16631/m.22888 type:complete len:516 (+) Transcript_16631:344-1891(+)